MARISLGLQLLELMISKCERKTAEEVLRNFVAASVSDWNDTNANMVERDGFFLN